MTLRLIGPMIAIAVNLPLAIWALAKAPKDPAYRTFAMFAIGLVLWNLGGEVFYRGGVAEVYLRLSFFGMVLAPATFLALAVNSRRDKPAGDLWVMALYLPALAMGIWGNPHQAPATSSFPLWRRGLYALSPAEAWLLIGMFAAYLAAALALSWRDTGKENKEWVFKLVLIPLVVGVIAVVLTGMLRHERAPMVSLWVMIMAQYAMFMMVRHGMVPLEIDRQRGAAVAVASVLLGLLVVLGISLVKALFGKAIGQEATLILVMGAVALCVLFAALVPTLEAWLEAFSRKKRM